MEITQKIKDWYGKYERPVSSLSLLGGFVFDAVALKRVDQFWENVFVIGHIVIVAVCMILIQKWESNPGDEADPNKLHFWLVNGLQFVFGGLLSVFLVFYFRSSDLSVSWLFLLVLALAFWANESLKRQFVRITFQVSLFFLSLFTASIFIVPIVIHHIGSGTFVLSGVVSVFIMYGFLRLLSRANPQKFEQSRRAVIISIGLIFLGMNVLYFTNLIPPIPLSLKDSGLYHSIQKYGTHGYEAKYEDVGWRAYVQLHDDFHAKSGENVYAYSAVFSPTSLNTTILHVWQYYDETVREWVTSSTVELALLGGREDGFRTFSKQVGLAPGKWRVNVLTQSGQVLGRLRFTIIPVSTVPTLSTKIM